MADDEPDVSVNGAHSSAGPANPPGLEDVLIAPGGRGGPDLTDAMLRGSNDPAELLARTRLTSDDIDNLLQLLSDENYIRDGHSDVQKLIWIQLTAKISLNGGSRAEAVAMITQRDTGFFRPYRAGGGVRGALRRGRTIDKEEVTP